MEGQDRIAVAVRDAVAASVEGAHVVSRDTRTSEVTRGWCAGHRGLWRGEEGVQLCLAGAGEFDGGIFRFLELGRRLLGAGLGWLLRYLNLGQCGGVGESVRGETGLALCLARKGLGFMASGYGGVTTLGGRGDRGWGKGRNAGIGLSRW